MRVLAWIASWMEREAMAQRHDWFATLCLGFTLGQIVVAVLATIGGDWVSVFIAGGGAVVVAWVYLSIRGRFKGGPAMNSPMVLTPDQRELILAWLGDQRETWANVGDRSMLSAIDTLEEQARQASEPDHG